MADKFSSTAQFKSGAYAGEGCTRIAKDKVMCPATAPRPEGKKGKKAQVLYGQPDIFEKEAKRGVVKNAADQLRARGLDVVVDEKASKKDIVRAAHDKETTALVVSTHGNGKGGVWGTDGALGPEAIDPKKSKGKALVDLQACKAGKQEKGWQKAFPGAKVVAPKTSITVGETIDHVTPDVPGAKPKAGKQPELRDLVTDVASQRTLPLRG